MMSEAISDTFILANMPYFISIHYQKLLKTQQPQEQVELTIHIYNLILRTLTIILVSQYLVRDRENVSDPYLDELLLQKFPHLTLDAWEEILFTALKAYEGKRDLFFIPELYDFYWDASTFPHKRRDEITFAFRRLTQAAVEAQTKRLLPQDEGGWKARADELREHLQKILRNLSFFEQYGLIRVLDMDDLFYSFETHKGLDLPRDRQPRPKFRKLTPGWFYLRTRGDDFLLLHPLLIFWEGDLKSNEIVATDTGIFDRLVYEQLQYLLAVTGQTSVDHQRVQEFVTLIYDTIAEAKRKRQRAEKLTWIQLCDICEDITRRRMATVQWKYRKELYLQRDKTRQKLELFLHDPEKRCFVLVGKSGVGKSNFLLALGEEMRRLRRDMCVLMYDGANLDVATSITGIVSQDVSDRLLLSGRQVQQIWHEIAKIDGIEERSVVLCVDAVNENPQAKELLRQLDALVQGPWPWLKIIFTSRPETWQTIKRGVKLAEALYYQEQDTKTLGVELEPFSYSERMESFSRQELPEAYGRYRQAFELQTPYDNVSNELREALRDPLNLWLVAKTYRGQTLPRDLKATMLIEHYVNALLQEETLRFLEKHLIPLMVREGHYRNVITTADLDAAGDTLYASVFSEQVLSDGRVANASFRHLTDADILVVQRQGIEQKISFKYERFYEYFVGKRIANLSEAQKDRAAFFLGLIEEIAHTPFLWGAVKNALVQEAKKPGAETILKLCRTAQQRVKEMMVSVLTQLGLDSPAIVEEILKKLMPQEKKATEWRKGRWLLGKSSQPSDIVSRNAGRIAIEVARNVGIHWVLQRGALHEDQSLRAATMRYTYTLWLRDQAGGFVILEYLATQAVRGILPNMLALESALGLSATIFFEHYQDKSVLVRLQRIWRGIIASLLHDREGKNSLERAIRAFLRERIFSLVSSTAFRLLREAPSNDIFNLRELEAFFRASEEEKALYQRLVQYIDVHGPYARERMEYDYHQAIKRNNLLFILVTDMGLIAHICHAPLSFLPFVRSLFDEAKSDQVSYAYLGQITNVLENALNRCMLGGAPELDEVFDLYVKATETSQEYYASYPALIRNRTAEAPQTFFLGPYTLHHHYKTGIAKTPLLEKRIQDALASKDLFFFKRLIGTELDFIAMLWHRPRLALEVVELFFDSHHPEIDEMIRAFLSRLKIRYPDEVDDFLEAQRVSDDFRLQVQTNEPVETLGELIGQNAWYFLRDEVILKSPELRSLLIQVFDKAPDCKNLRTWLDYFIRQIVNCIYGEEILRRSAE